MAASAVSQADPPDGVAHSSNDGVLLHLLTADLRRYAIQSFDAGQADVLARLLAIIDGALREGTDDVPNAIAVSFVEDTGWWDPAMQRFIEAWPEGSGPRSIGNETNASIEAVLIDLG